MNEETLTTLERASQIAGINNPEIAEKADLPRSSQLTARRSEAVTTAQEAEKRVDTTRSALDGLEQEGEQGFFKRMISRITQALGGGKSLEKRKEELQTDLQQREKQQADAESEVRYHEYWINLLPRKERQAIIAERIKEAERIQTIATGVALAEKLEKEGLNSKDWGMDLALNRQLGSETDPDKKAKIEEVSGKFEAGLYQLEARHYQKAALVYDQWLKDVSSRLKNKLDGDHRERLSVITFEKSLKALVDRDSQIAEGVSGGEWFTKG